MRLQFIFLVLIMLFIAGCGSHSSNAVSSTTGGTTENQTGVTTPTSSTDTVRIVIDRAPHVNGGTGQRLELYENNVLKDTFVISTGRETFDLPPLYNIEPYCSITPKGTFHPTKLVEMYYSNTWATAEVVKDGRGKPVIDPDTGLPKETIHPAEMPHAIFFHGGVAIHGTEYVSNLGHPASGACVRERPDQAEIAYNAVKGLDFKNVVIQVIDSRPLEEQQAIQAQCDADAAWYKEANQDCFETQASVVANNTTPDQPTSRGFLAGLFGRGGIFAAPQRQLTGNEVIAVKKYCRAKLRADLSAQRR